MINKIVSSNFTSIEQVAGRCNRNSTISGQSVSAQTDSFESILSSKKSIEQLLDNSKSQIKFTKHAGERLDERDIKLTTEQMNRLEEGTQKASSKGIKETLILMDNMAFIVNTQSKTVITAMDQTNNNNNVYTNIDGAVII
jgi:flagellar operon protein